MSAVQSIPKKWDGKSSECPIGSISKQKITKKIQLFEQKEDFVVVANSLFHTVPLIELIKFFFQLQKTQSSEEELLLRSVALDTTGIYRCEISGEAPLFQTASREAVLAVVGKFKSLNDYGPSQLYIRPHVVITLQQKFQEGQLNCIAYCECLSFAILYQVCSRLISRKSERYFVLHLK